MRLRGTLSYFSDGAWTSVRPGGAVFLPWGCLRTYRNDRDQTSRRWVVTTLSGFEVLRAECGPVRAGRAWSGSWVSPPSTASSPVAAVGVSQRRTLFGDGRDVLRRE